MEILKKKSLFWDVETLDQDKDADFIIGRILGFGDIEDFNWALAYYGRGKVEQVLRQTKQLDKKSISFWCLVFNIDPSTCISKQSVSQPSAFSQR